MAAPQRTLVQQCILGVKVACGGHFIMSYLGYPQETAGPSMLPTLEVRSDWVWVDPMYRRGRGIRAGDQVSVKHPTSPGDGWGKRVIGMPGDFVRIDSPGVRQGSARSSDDGQEGLGPEFQGVGRAFEGTRELAELDRKGKYIQVPDGHCWMEGDNPPWSKDSRDYGPVPLALIRGKVVARVYPFSRTKWMSNTFDNQKN